MKKWLLISCITASLLTYASAHENERMGSFVGAFDIEEHMAQAVTAEHNESLNSNMHQGAMEKEHNESLNGNGQQEGMKNSSLSHPDKPLFENILNHSNKQHLEVEELIATPQSQLPQEVKEMVHKIKKAVKFYKKPELFEDLNISNVEELTEQKIGNEIEKRVQKALQERMQEIKEQILKEREKVELPIAGEFVQIGEGQYDWAFVTPGGKVFKLDGVDENGKFKYKPLNSVLARINKDGTISFNGFNPDAINLPGTQKGYPFVQYGDPEENGFDWVLVAPNGQLFKLEGFDEDSGSFVYTPVEGVQASQKGEFVDILPGVAQE